MENSDLIIRACWPDVIEKIPSKERGLVELLLKSGNFNTSITDDFCDELLLAGRGFFDCKPVKPSSDLDYLMAISG